MPGKSASILIIILLGLMSIAMAQSSPKRMQIALFTPLYLDSAFDRTTTEYLHGKNFPKYINAGLEFYEGAQLAADSMEKEGLPLDVYVYDSRSAATSVAQVIRSGKIDSVDMIIGHVNGSEARLLANAASKKHIPFINATFPNDAGVTGNPDFVILNSTLFTHCAAIYRFIQKNHALAPVVMFRKKGAQEERLKTYFEDITKSTASVPLKIKYVTLENDFDANDLKDHLDDERQTVVIAASLDISFANRITEQLASAAATHPSVIFGMPTWWESTNFSKPEFAKSEVIFTTPFYVSPTHPLSVELTNIFKSTYFSRPTDMFFRGFETLYHFAHLLQLNGKNIGSSLSDKRFRVFTDFDIQPVLNRKTNTLDYFENKKIYFIKKVSGTITAVY